MSAIFSPLLKVISYGALCAASLATGGAVAAFWPPTARLRSSIRHVAAGFVFAAVGVEVLPEVVHRDLPLAVAGGFSVGIALMLLIRILSEEFEERTAGRAGAWPFIGAVLADIFIDGLLIGVSFVIGRGQGRQALLVTIALAVELLSLGLSISATLGKYGTSRMRIILTTNLVALSPPIGAVTGYFLGKSLSGGWIEGVLAFAAAALLYLAAEELLKEAHEVPETVTNTALFFGAFLVLMLIDMVSNKAGG